MNAIFCNCCSQKHLFIKVDLFINKVDLDKNDENDLRKNSLSVIETYEAKTRKQPK